MFTFNFLVPELDTSDGPLQSSSVNIDLDETITDQECTDHHRHRQRLPFSWVDDLGPLLLDRAKEELVYTDISLATTTPTTSIRCVDLSRSSYRVPTKNEHAEQKSEAAENDNDDVGDRTEERVWKTTDIETDIYEGGRKVWECSRDLMEFMVQEGIGLSIKHDSAAMVERPFFCLELGCGHGLPGCYLIREALSRCRDNHVSGDFVVVLTDYNNSVVMDATLSNLVLNCLFARHDHEDDMASWIPSAVDSLLQNVRVGAGDWMDMSEQLLQIQNRQQDDGRSLLPSDGKFDLILAAETLYSESAACETAVLLQRHLRPSTGVAYVATKRYYFGVGGGVDSFRKFANEVNMKHEETTGTTRLTIETVRVHDNGTGNIREVLKVQNIPY